MDLKLFLPSDYKAEKNFNLMSENCAGPFKSTQLMKDKLITKMKFVSANFKIPIYVMHNLNLELSDLIIPHLLHYFTFSLKFSDLIALYCLLSAALFTLFLFFFLFFLSKTVIKKSCRLLALFSSPSKIVSIIACHRR